MKSSPILQRVLMIAGVAVALWAAGAGRASAQCEECLPPPCFESEGDIVCTFTPESNSHTFTFDANNSLKITTQVNEGASFEVTVQQIEISQSDYQNFRKSPNFQNSQCWETAGPGFCVFYRVTSNAQQDVDYTGDVHYIIGFTTPAVKGNKHDLMLLVSEVEAPNGLFEEEITTKVIRNYQVGDDPGVAGDRGGFSDYIVAKEVVRPVSKKK
jgi:hypothetical protein